MSVYQPICREQGFTMLVLTRKSLESVVVGGYDRFERLLKVTVLGIGNGKVRLGFEADAEVPIHRLEVWEKINTGAQPDSPPASLDGPTCDRPPP